MLPSGKAFRLALKQPRCGSSSTKKEFGLNPPCGSPSGCLPEEGDDKNLEKDLYPCPSWNFAGEEGDRLVGE
jgi:hypothetical protein